MQSYILLPTCLSHPKEKIIYMLAPQATTGSFLNVSKIPSVPLPEKAIYQSSFHTRVTQAGLSYSQFYSGLSYRLTLTLGKSPRTNEQNALWQLTAQIVKALEESIFRNLYGQKHLENEAKRKHSSSTVMCANSDCRKSTSLLRKVFSSPMPSPPMCLQMSVYLYFY